MFRKIFNFITHKLMKPRPYHGADLLDYERLCYEIRPCDVLLISGRSRVSDVIKLVTQSRWTHSAIYIGRLHDIDDDSIREKILQNYAGPANEPLIIESELGKGTIVSSLSFYKDYPIRICRPRGLSRKDAHKVITYAVNHIGHSYDVRQLFDLARFLFPWSILPRRWRSSLFRHNAGTPTKESCSLLIAQAFAAVNFPILPFIRKDHQTGKFTFYPRNPRLYVPNDFDSSPYFDIIKYPIFESAHTPTYHSLPWEHGMLSDHDGNIYTIENHPSKKTRSRTTENKDNDEKEK